MAKPRTWVKRTVAAVLVAAALACTGFAAEEQQEIAADAIAAAIKGQSL